MKIIKSGMSCKKKDKNETMRLKCNHCNTKLEIKAKDVHFYMNIFLSFLSVKYHFQCPCCKKWTKIKLRKMTPNFKYWVQYHNGTF